MGRTKEQNAHLHTFLCCPHEQPKEQSHRSSWEQNSHPASEQSTPLVPFTSLQVVLTLWGPSSGMVSQTQTACAANFLHRKFLCSISCTEPFVFIIQTHLWYFPRNSPFPKAEWEPSPCYKSVSAFLQDSEFCCPWSQVWNLQWAHSPFMGAVLKAPSWNPFSCHMKGWTHTTQGQKQFPATSSNSLQRDPAEFWLNSLFLGKPQSHSALGAHHTSLQGNEKQSDTSLSSPQITAVKFCGLIRHFYLQWESKHRQEICQVMWTSSPNSLKIQDLLLSPQMEQSLSQWALFI